ncbi:MAG: TetR/AcrR family transcriptional regulator [Polyangiaceae bacterium]|nr:TetR/AcrR family transcriptional regulator [Polyangiaceae bacterium]
MKRPHREDPGADPDDFSLERLLPRLLKRQPVQARSRALVGAILTAFDQMLRQSSDERQITLETLVERAGVGIGSFYEYFSNKDALIGALVEKATRDNFDDLLRNADAAPDRSFETVVRGVGVSVAETYLRHPARTRTLIAGIGKLGLLGLVVRERDRFADRIAVVAHRYLPHETMPSLETTMRFVADACMGVVSGKLYRRTPGDDRTFESIDVEEAGVELFELAMAIIRARHDLSAAR